MYYRGQHAQQPREQKPALSEGILPTRGQTHQEARDSLHGDDCKWHFRRASAQAVSRRPPMGRGRLYRDRENPITRNLELNQRDQRPISRRLQHTFCPESPLTLLSQKGLRCWYVIQWSRGVARSLPRGARLAPAARALGQAGHGLAGPGPG